MVSLISRYNRFIIVSPKFPEGTVAGVYKRAMAKNEYYDAARFGTQKLNWTLREFDVNILLMNDKILEILISFCKWIG